MASDVMREKAREWIRAHRPEPLKCEHCGQPQPTVVAGSWAYSCEKAPQGEGHMYMVTAMSAQDIEEAEASNLAAFASSVQAEGREAHDEDWSYCLKIHWLHAIQCNHENRTDEALCICGWRSNPECTVGLAVASWIMHVRQMLSVKPGIALASARAQGMREAAEIAKTCDIYDGQPINDVRERIAQAISLASEGKKE